MKRPEAPQPPRAFFIFRYFEYALEVKLQAELNQPRIPIGRNLTKGAAPSGSIWIQELDVIESVEKFRPELDCLGFEDLGFLDDRKVVIVDAWTTQEIARRVAKTEERHIDAVVGGGIEPERSRHVAVRVRGIGADTVCLCS